MNYTPTEIGDDLVPRFLAGEAMTTREIATEFGVRIQTAQEGVRRARDVLLDAYNVVLPIAHYSDDYVLVITTKALDAFLGEVPQLRALRTRERNIWRRLNGAFALVTNRPKHAQVILRGLEHAFTGVEIQLESVETYMVDIIDGEPK
jgi:hypothetical protein